MASSSRFCTSVLMLAGFLGFNPFPSQANVVSRFENVKIQTKQNGSVSTTKTVSSQEAKTLLQTRKKVVILDVRTPEEFAAGHLQNAQLLNKFSPDFEKQLRTLDRNKEYLVYCKVGGRSGDATKLMAALGFKTVYDATQGFESLKNAGIPVAK